VTSKPAWSELQTLEIGDHMHLDGLVDDPPPPGSRDWLPVLEQLVAYLVRQDGHWGVTLRVGVAPHLPKACVTAANVFEYVDSTQVSEPPAVYRLTDKALANTWEGEYHGWNRVLEPRVTEDVRFDRPKNDLPDSGGWFAQVTFEIRRTG
jgi:hypothetical protein